MQCRDVGRPTAIPTFSEEHNYLLRLRILKFEGCNFPLDEYDVRIFIKNYLDNQGKRISVFNDNNIPNDNIL